MGILIHHKLTSSPPKGIFIHHKPTNPPPPPKEYSSSQANPHLALIPKPQPHGEASEHSPYLYCVNTCLYEILKMKSLLESFGTFLSISLQHFLDDGSLIQSMDKDWTCGWLSLLTGIPVDGAADIHAVKQKVKGLFTHSSLTAFQMSSLLSFCYSPIYKP